MPRHFRCHCDIEQDDTGPEDDLGKRKIPPPAPMFRSNPGVTGVAFSDKYPYFDTIPEKAKKNIFIAAERLMPIRSKERQIENRKKYNSYSKEYERVGFDKKSGGYIVKHKQHGKTKSHENAAYDYLMKQGYAIELPAKPNRGKHPDSIVNGILRELKSFLNSGNLQNSISTAVSDKVKQSQNLLFHVSQDFSYDDVLNGIRGGFLKEENAESVLLIFSNHKHRLFDRREILREDFVIKTIKEMRADKP